jgi:hypothetical protein
MLWQGQGHSCIQFVHKIAIRVSKSDQNMNVDIGYIYIYIYTYGCVALDCKQDVCCKKGGDDLFDVRKSN